MNGRTQFGVGLDAGSYLTRCVVYAVEDLSVRLAGCGLARSAGWTKGRISDRDAASDSILKAVQEAESQAQIPIESVTVGIGGASVFGDNSRGVYEFGRPREIDSRDLAYAIELASRVRLEDDRTLLHVFPQEFILDGRAGHHNPRGSTCARLEANVHFVTASAQNHLLLVSAVHQAHLEVEETVFEPVAAAYAALLYEDRSRGVALVDIGMHSTDIAIYDGDAMVLSAGLPVSGDHFTRDVAWGLAVTYEDAEHLKKEYGCAILGLTSDSSLIEVPSAPGRPAREAPRRLLNEILDARAEELFSCARVEIARSGMEQSLVEGVVLVGGGSRLHGMCDMAERVLNCQTRNGLVTGVEDWPAELNNATWTTAAGLAMYSARLKLHRARKKAPGFLGLVLRS